MNSVGGLDPDSKSVNIFVEIRDVGSSFQGVYDKDSMKIAG
jgi:hypothetical protein